MNSSIKNMNELKEIYDRITFLRGKGIKMKEMAEQAQLFLLLPLP